MRERKNSGEIVLQRRRAERAPFHTEVTCLFGEVSFSAITMNLSTTGCFVETGTPVPLLAAVDVILHLSDDLAPAKVGGHVVRTHLHPTDTQGFAVMFDCIDDATCSRIDGLAERAHLELFWRPSEAMTDSRRVNPRTRCRIPCEVQSSSDRADGTVLDVSEGGLSVQTTIEAEEGDVLLVHLRVPGERESLELESMVWRIQSVKDHQTGESFSVLGLMLSKAPEVYFKLLPR